MMVKVWFVRGGLDPTRGGPAYELTLGSCAETLGLDERHLISGPDKTPRFGDQSARLAGIADYRHVVCEIDEDEAKAIGWKAGFYKVEISPAEAANRLGPARKPQEIYGPSPSAI